MVPRNEHDRCDIIPMVSTYIPNITPMITSIMSGCQGHSGPEHIRTTCPGGGAPSHEQHLRLPAPRPGQLLHDRMPVPLDDVPARELVGATERDAKPTPGNLTGMATIEGAEAHPIVVPVPVRVGRMDAGVAAVQVGVVEPWLAGPAPAQEPVAGVPAHVVPTSRVLEGHVALAMTGPGPLRVVDIDVRVPEEVNAYIIANNTHIKQEHS